MDGKMNFTTYLEQYSLAALEKQDKLEQLLGDDFFELDLDAGKIRLGARNIPTQVIGTESDNTLTWLWAWADEQTEIPSSLLQSAIQLRNWGGNSNLPEFIQPSVDLIHADGNAIAMISSQVCKASCFYRDAYEGGAVFHLLFDREIVCQPPFDRARLFLRISDLFSRYELNHRNTMEAYCKSAGLSYRADVNSLNCELATGERMVVEFDESGRLVMFNGAPFNT